jgi:hypothetical protein
MQIKIRLLCLFVVAIAGSLVAGMSWFFEVMFFNALTGSFKISVVLITGFESCKIVAIMLNEGFRQAKVNIQPMLRLIIWFFGFGLILISFISSMGYFSHNLNQPNETALSIIESSFIRKKTDLIAFYNSKIATCEGDIESEMNNVQPKINASYKGEKTFIGERYRVLKNDCKVIKNERFNGLEKLEKGYRQELQELNESNSGNDYRRQHPIVTSLVNTININAFVKLSYSNFVFYFGLLFGLVMEAIIYAIFALVVKLYLSFNDNDNGIEQQNIHSWSGFQNAFKKGYDDDQKKNSVA